MCSQEAGISNSGSLCKEKNVWAPPASLHELSMGPQTQHHHTVASEPGYIDRTKQLLHVNQNNWTRVEIVDGIVTGFVLAEQFILCQDKGWSLGYFPGSSKELADWGVSWGPCSQLPVQH